MRKAKNIDANGQEVRWFDDDSGQQYVVIVESGHELPTELEDGTAVPARVRDGLIEQGGAWTEVKRSSGKGD